MELNQAQFFFLSQLETGKQNQIPIDCVGFALFKAFDMF